MKRCRLFPQQLGAHWVQQWWVGGSRNSRTPSGTLNVSGGITLAPETFSLPGEQRDHPARTSSPCAWWKQRLPVGKLPCGQFWRLSTRHDVMNNHFQPTAELARLLWFSTHPTFQSCSCSFWGSPGSLNKAGRALWLPDKLWGCLMSYQLMQCCSHVFSGKLTLSKLVIKQ